MTLEELIARAQQVYDETVTAMNTNVRIGSLFKDLANWVSDLVSGKLDKGTFEGTADDLSEAQNLEKSDSEFSVMDTLGNKSLIVDNEGIKGRIYNICDESGNILVAISKQFIDGLLTKSSLIDNLDSDSIETSVTAKQSKLIKSLIDSLNSVIKHDGDDSEFKILDGNKNVALSVDYAGVKAKKYNICDESGNILVALTYDVIQQLLAISENNKLFGKKIAFIGDSITYGGAGVTPAYGGFAKIIGQKNNMTWQNYGVGGTCITKQESRTDSIIERIANYSTDFDFVCIQGGLNDIAQVAGKIGVVSIGYDAVLDVYTFCGALEFLCKYSLEKYAGKKVCCLINYQIGSTEWGTLWAEKMEEIFKKWSMPYLDLRKFAGFNLANPDLRAIYGVSTGSYPEYNSSSAYALDDIIKYNGSTYKANQIINSPSGAFDYNKWTQVSTGTYDSWHCNVLGYNLLAPKIESFLNSL